MNLTIENILLIGSLLLLISVFAGKTSYRFGLPTLLLFLAIGMLSGSDGIVGIKFDDPKVAQFIGIVSLNFILFSGGLDTNWNSVRPTLWQGISLSTFGVLLTAVSLGVFVWLITDFTIYESLLLGSIVSSTDAAAVFSILRSKNLALKSNLRYTLEMESGSNDPMAYVLTIAFLSLVVNQDQSFYNVFPLFLQQMALGLLLGIAFGKLSKLIINGINLDFEGLYPVLAIALMFLTFSATDFVGGNGFLAIYISAVYLGNQVLMHKKALIKAFDGFAWLMQIVLFLTLGLLVFPSQIVPYIGFGLLISFFLILVARPLAVMLSLLPFRMKFRKRVYISWVGLRGAVPIVFATYPLLAGIDKADMIFNIVFFIAITSVLVQGTSLTLIARLLHVSLPERVKPISPTEALIANNPKAIIREIVVASESKAVNRKIVDLEFPESTIIAMIKRGGKFIIPSGSTEILPLDTLVVLSDRMEGIKTVYGCLQMDYENPSTL